MREMKDSGVTFDEWLLAVIQDMHSDWDEDRVRSNANTIYTAAQCFPDEKGEVPGDGAKAEIINCLKIWRSYDYR